PARRAGAAESPDGSRVRTRCAALAVDTGLNMKVPGHQADGPAPAHSRQVSHVIDTSAASTQWNSDSSGMKVH
ncbi:hypothetical protein, partial [Mycobacteroides abscessus]|uniref:hypothetical protein n=1 Tax=Mycobacteroides abscessus TaxID=36809 RepID=UPI001A9756CA